MWYMNVLLLCDRCLKISNLKFCVALQIHYLLLKNQMRFSLILVNWNKNALTFILRYSCDSILIEIIRQGANNLAWCLKNPFIVLNMSYKITCSRLCYFISIWPEFGKPKEFGGLLVPIIIYWSDRVFDYLLWDLKSQLSPVYPMYFTEFLTSKIKLIAGCSVSSCLSWTYECWQSRCKGWKHYNWSKFAGGPYSSESQILYNITYFGITEMANEQFFDFCL